MGARAGGGNSRSSAESVDDIRKGEENVTFPGSKAHVFRNDPVRKREG